MQAHAAFRLVTLAALLAYAAQAQNNRALIVAEDGGQLPGVPQVIAKSTELRSGQCIVFNVSSTGAVAYVIRGASDDKRVLDGCRVTIGLAGYRTMEATLTEGATVTLKRIGEHEGTTVSVVSAKASKDARKAYERGLAAASQKKYEAAAKAFEAAVAAYPQYAQAWSDLGVVQAALNRPEDARASWEHAVQSDPQYLKPYARLAQLAIAEGRNEDALEITRRGLEFNPVQFPAIYFYNAAAQFNLKHYDEAEKSALETIAHDHQRDIPMVESLLGSILAAQGHLDTAIDHLHKYLELAPHAADAAAIRERIADLERRGMEMK